MSDCDCGAAFVAHDEEQSTLMGSLFREPGHDHNDNCRIRVYRCAAGHATTIAIIRRCPACAWTGKRSCGVCHARFVEAWPKVTP